MTRSRVGRTLRGEPRMQRTMITLLALLFAALAGCSTPKILKRERAPAPAPAIEPVAIEVTPRELLTARLVNPAADDSVPPITVGKLIEYADRYLSCDCSGTRFVQSWQRLPGGYRLSTNSSRVRPLDFYCDAAEGVTRCFLTEIDRGSNVDDLTERFVPGAEFIRFMYENGLKCEREGPCPAPDGDS